MTGINELIPDEQHLEELLSRPSRDVIDLVGRMDGDYLLLGIAGKIGPSLARMLKRACTKAHVDKQVFGVSRFTNPKLKKDLKHDGVNILQGDLLDPDFIHTLPEVQNVIFLAGMKFGSEDNLPMTWAVNSYLPALVAAQFKKSRIVAFSTGCVYELVPVKSGGSVETDTPLPLGEYAQSCLGRERMFEYGSIEYGTPTCIIRLNYAVELRYGVLLDIAFKVWNEEKVDLTMGYFNVIWQRDANEFVLRSFDYCRSPARILNVTGAENLSIRETALRFGDLFNKKVRFSGKESDTALLSNARQSFDLFGQPKTDVAQMIHWIAGWIKNGKETYNKPTHFEVRNGKY